MNSFSHDMAHKGEPMPTLAEIAKQAGVSTAVVSRIVNNDKSLRVSKETRERVKKVVEESGYAPNRAARSLRSTETGLVAMVFHDVTNPVYAEIARGAHHAATAAGKSILNIDAQAGEKALASVLDLISGRGIDGLVLQAADVDTDVLIARAARENVPTVQLQARIDTNLPVVTLPDLAAARIATQHLIDQGHTSIACAATKAGLSFTDDRVKGWKQTLQAAGRDINASSLTYTEPTLEGGKHAFDALYASEAHPTAVVCCNVLSAIGMMERAREQKIQVPEQIAIVGIHDIPFAEYCYVALTTVRMPLFELGREAIKVLFERSAYSSQMLITVNEPPRLIQRSSS